MNPGAGGGEFRSSFSLGLSDEPSMISQRTKVKSIAASGTPVHAASAVTSKPVVAATLSREAGQWVGRVLLVGLVAGWATTAPGAAPVEHPRLRVAAAEFGLLAESDAPTSSRVGARASEIAGPLRTTILLLEDRHTRLCMVTTHFGPTIAANVSQLLRESLAGKLRIPASHVWIFTSHNHSGVDLARNAVPAHAMQGKLAPPADLLPIGQKFLAELLKHAECLPERLQPVTVWWAVGHEDRFTYNRKARRADGSTYFMREEDRLLVGKDYRGDIDTQAPVVAFKNRAGRIVAALCQFTGHPVTSYHPEKPVVFGDWPQVAADVLAERLDPAGPAPVGFLQGCAGDVNSKEMFSGGVKRATEFGRMLGDSYVKAMAGLQPSRRDGLDVAVETVPVPLAPLPTREQLKAELEEMDAFLKRANAGDEDTRSCVGLNFPRALSPRYRARLIDPPRAWNVWALDLHERGQAESVPKHLDLEIAVIRVGDVGIVGLPCEPFQGIGRLVRRDSPLPMSVPCGYANVSYGYITDSLNTGDREYMSAFYRYTKYRPPLARPAGDVLAQRAVEVLRRFAQESNHR